MKQLLIFDFDYTLFDTHAFRGEFMRAAEAQGISGKQFIAWYRMRPEVRQDWYMNFPLEQAAEFRPKADIMRLRRSLEIATAFSKYFLYADTAAALGRLARAGHTLALCTYGERTFQGQKFENCHLSNLFSFVRITGNIEKAYDVRELSAQAHSRFGHVQTFFVEDNPKALYAAKKLCPDVVTILMQREEGIYPADPDASRLIDHTVRTMGGVERIIRMYAKREKQVASRDTRSWTSSLLTKIMKKK